MKNCPTSNMNRSRLWGFEVTHIITAFSVTTVANVLLNVFGLPLILSWALGLLMLLGLRLVSVGQKNGHLELLARCRYVAFLFNVLSPGVCEDVFARIPALLLVPLSFNRSISYLGRFV